MNIDRLLNKANRLLTKLDTKISGKLSPSTSPASVQSRPSVPFQGPDGLPPRRHSMPPSTSTSMASRRRMPPPPRRHSTEMAPNLMEPFVQPHVMQPHQGAELTPPTTPAEGWPQLNSSEPATDLPPSLIPGGGRRFAQSGRPEVAQQPPPLRRRAQSIPTSLMPGGGRQSIPSSLMPGGGLRPASNPQRPAQLPQTPQTPQQPAAITMPVPEHFTNMASPPSHGLPPEQVSMPEPRPRLSHRLSMPTIPTMQAGVTGPRFDLQPMQARPAEAVRFSDVQQMDSHYHNEQHGAVFGTSVKYLNAEERKAYRVTIQNGLLMDAKGQPVDTRNASTAFANNKGRAIFVMDPQGNIYLSNEQTRGKFHHSSFMGGGVVAAAGDIRVENGKIVAISRKSGHYRPTEAQIKQFADHIYHQGAQGFYIDPDLS